MNRWSDVPSRSDLLLQYLIDIQQAESFISAEAIQRLSTDLSIPAAQIKSVIEFYSFLHTRARGHFNILFSDNISDQMAGSRALLQQLCQRLKLAPGEPRADGRVTIDTTSCTGMSDQGPAMLVNNIPITRLNRQRIEKIAECVEQDKALEQWPAEFFEVHDNIRRADILLTENTQDGDALHALREEGADKLLQRIDDSGLRGRGGAGFKTATKWRLCQQVEAQQHVVVCNADEGEPGTFKDRVLLQSYSAQVIEGMTLCAGIIGARKGFIYLRGEYFYLLEPLERELQRRRDANLLGERILDQADFNFDIEIHLGAGAYICGEESALLESLAGRRGIPQKRPPFPVERGYLGYPTVVNNVETLMAACQIASHGSDWFTDKGTRQSSGTKLLSISGDCHLPGIYEYPMGISVAEILVDCGAEETQAVQIAGAAGQTLCHREFKRHIAMEDASTGGSFMIFNRQRDLLDMVRNFAHFFAHESCGFCTPCRVGSSLICNLVDKLYTSHATQNDLRDIERIALVMRHASHCGLGATASNHILDTFNNFPDSYQRRLRSTEYTPAFDLDGAVSEARAITGRDDAAAHIPGSSAEECEP
ncbi:NAD-reducing [NiFe] hydrogenase HoxFUYH(E), subunit alpha (HoxF) [hydrothermal vent metagenome]|uniref:NAD-reducing [NiFe] hydrogenase HoxFUYH(E), subunit alpha (HoxF) n=1 Tax=hydrothermal vent metagenome TaxID=652676 RepID=A0A3B1BLL1_9ZZZZ